MSDAHDAPTRSNDRPFLVRMAIWLAVVFGLTEAALVAVVAFGLGRFMHVSPQLVWQAPLVYAIVFLFFAALVVLPWPFLDAKRRLRTLAFACALIGCVSILHMASQLGKTAVWILAAGISVQFSLLALRFEDQLRRLVRFTLVPGLLTVAAMGMGLNGAWWVSEWRGTTARGTNGPQPNVVLIIWDTVRAASLSLYGYERKTTLHLEQLADGAVVFENAFAPAPWTLPSHASMFTGRETNALSTDWSRPLGDGVTTLAEALSRRGYRTGGFVANTYFAGRESGLSRGFAHYEDYPLLSVQQLVRSTTLGRRLIRSPRIVETFDLDPSMELKPASDITDAALSWITAEPGRPFFAFLNYLDAHSPYSPPPEYASRFGTTTRNQKLNFGNGRALTATELQAEIDAYDAAIAYLDDELDRLVGALRDAGLLDNTIVVVTSDHGEEFGEHDVYLHGSTLFDRALHVPLVIRSPGVGGGVRRDDWVSLRHLPSTILALAGAEGGTLPGRPLTWALEPDDGTRQVYDTIVAEVSRRPGVLARYPAAKGRMSALMMDPWKYIRRGDGVEQVFDLRADRDERRNLMATAPSGLLQVARTRTAAGRRVATR